MIGLSEKEHLERLEKYGKNTLDDVKKTSFLSRFVKQFDIMLIVLLFAGVISIGIAIYFKNYDDLFEGILILVICFANALIGVIQEGKAQNSLEELKKMTQTHCKVRRDNKVIITNIEDLTIGDVVLLETGDVVPADIKLIEDVNLWCDESCLTGESQSVEKKSNGTESNIISKNKTMIYRNTIIVSGHCEGLVIKIGKDTEIGKIATQIVNTKKEMTPLQRTLNKLNEKLSVYILIICAVVYIVELFCNKGFIDSFLIALTLTVSAVPESLPTVTSVIMAMGVGKLSKKGAIVKNLSTIETLGCCQIICTDKTGTLTKNKMKVTEIFLPRYNQTQPLIENVDFDFDKMLKCMILGSNAIISSNTIIGDSTESALIDCVLNYQYNIDELRKNQPSILELPFDSNRKMMTKIVKDKFITSYSKGSLENILKNCTHYLCNGVIENLTIEKKQQFLKISSTMNKKSLRVLGFAYKEHTATLNNKYQYENNMIFIGSCGMIDPPREEVYDAIKQCHKAGLKPIMITGDSKDTAFSVAKDLGICQNEDEILLGEDIDNIDDAVFRQKLEKFNVFARVNPEHKVKIVKAYQERHKIVAMTGDGVNDAPSLKMANIGVAMGSGTEVAKNAGDIIITDDNFSTIVVAIKEGRKIFQNIQKTLHFLLSTNLVEVITILLTTLLFPSNTFLLPSQLLFINLVTDGLPAFSLGMENAEKDIMSKPPRDDTFRLFDKKQIFSMIIQALYQVILLMTMYTLCIWYVGDKVANTMCFFTFSLMQTNHSINIKTNQSIFKINLFENGYFNFSYIFCIGLNLILLTPLGKLFNLVKLSLIQWIVVILTSFSIIPFVEIQKILTNGKILSKK